MNTANYKQPWLHSAWLDVLFIILPPFAALLLVAFMPSDMKQGEGMSVAMWVMLVLLIDVAHVYSTLYRTYFDKAMLQNNRQLLINIPLFAFVGGVVLYSMDAMVFWRVLAYIAVFHFVRQQYGFMRLYSRKQAQAQYARIVDMQAIYSATLYPIIYWHASGQRNFNWFVQGDFYYINSSLLLNASQILYGVILIAYLVKEAYTSYTSRSINLPKNLLVLGTYSSWYFGIVYFNGDVAFTALNVISHGIPYIALIWVYGKKKEATANHGEGSSWLRGIFTSAYGIVIFLAIIIFFAFVEEGLWDAMVWQEHSAVFKPFYFMPHVTTNLVLTFLVPLLTLPQITHYIIDGFIWKVGKEEQIVSSSIK